MNIRNYIIVLLVFWLSLFVSCKKSENGKIMTIPINNGWTFKNTNDSIWFPAIVPGDVLSDLLHTHQLSDPFFRVNEKQFYKLETSDWEYKTRFSISPLLFAQDIIELRFDGLDTYADIKLNDSLILSTDNMFRSWTVNCKKNIHLTDNELKIVFHSTINIGMKKLKTNHYNLPTMEEQAPDDKQTSPFTRKASFQFGFDGGPRLVNAGIWRPIKLIGWSSAKFSEFYLKPEFISPKIAKYNALCTIRSVLNTDVSMDLLVNNKIKKTITNFPLKVGDNQIKIPFEIRDPYLWWTNNLGIPYLYDITVNLKIDQSVIDEKNTKLGVRKLELIQKPDSFGTSFYFKLNDVPVFMKGANYIPTDALLSRNNSRNYKRLIDDAVSCNMNMLRIWGGGIYENEDFYNYCDSIGLLIWQDFMFSSAMQPGNKAHIENIKYEAVENVKRLRNHACLALWCGNSEVMVNWNYLWKKNYLKAQAKQIERQNDSLFRNLLHEIVLENDSKTPYWVSSPSGENATLPDTRSGDEHDWSVWYNGASVDEYGEYIGRFVSEYGMQSIPSINLLKKSTFPEDLIFKSEVLEWKQRNIFNWASPVVNGTDMINKYTLENFNATADFGRFVFLSQLTQSMGLQTAIEHHRLNKSRNMGSLLWQLNDCWPGITWSIIDYNGNWKPAAYAVKRSFEPVTVIPKLENNVIQVHAVSDVLKETEAILLVKLIDFYGNILYVKQIPVKIPANKASIILSLKESEVLKFAKQNSCCLIVQLNLPSKTLSQNILYFSVPKKLLLPHPKLEIGVNEAVKGYNIILRSDVFVRNVFMETNNLQCEFSDNNIDLLPGKRIKINVRYNGTKEQLLKDLKIQYL